MKQVLLVTATKTKTLEEFQQRPLAKSLQVLSDIRYPDDTLFDFEIVKDNTAGLPEVYNRYLTEENRDKIVLFCHDDVFIEDLYLVEKLNDSPFDVTVLAGAQEFNKQSPKLAWHLAARRETLRGEVAHTKDGKVFTTVFGPVPDRVVTSDGVFIAVNVERVLETNTKFVEVPELSFHFYDIAFSLECYKNKLTTGVLPIRIIHHGLGDSMLTPQWETANNKFRELYC